MLSLTRAPTLTGRDECLLPDLYRGEGLLVVIAMTLSVATLIALAEGGLLGFDWLVLGRVALLGLGIALFSAMFLSLMEHSLTFTRPVYSTLVAYVLVLGVAVVMAVSAEQAMKFALIRSSFSWEKVANTIVLVLIPAGIVLAYLIMWQWVRIQHKAETEARIQALQARIRPHFLFNSMNMVASLIGSDPAKAERVVEDLSDLFRRVLTGPQSLVPLREELALCRSYLALEKMRLDDRLDAEWQISDYGDDVQIPCLSLQPVLENAIYHGIQLIPEGGKVEIKVKRVKNKILITVCNPLNPRIQYNKGSKMALDNVRQRLKAHFGPSAEVRSEVMDNKYTTEIIYHLDR